MSGWRRALGAAVSAAAIVAFVWAAPSSAAPEKIFSLTVPTSVEAGATGVQYLLTFKNETPSGNSSINSLKASVTSGLTITNATAPNGNVTWTATQVAVSNMAPLKPGRSFVVTLTVNVASTSCASSSATWSAQAWTGSSFSGTTFRLLGAPYSQLVTQIAADCELRFVAGRSPANGIQDAPITSADGSAVQVELVEGGAPAPWFDGTVTITATSAPLGAVLSGNSVLAVDGVASFPSLSADTPGDYVVEASALSLTSDPASFTIFSDGIFCGDVVGGSGEGTSIELTRTDPGPEGGCEEIPYTLTVTRNVITFLKDEATLREQGGQFQIVITWDGAVDAYPTFGETQFDLDGPDGPIAPFTPDLCQVVGGVPQYPDNPNENGYYPAPGTVEPWCVSEVVIQPAGDVMQATETFLGSGDPYITR